LLCYYFAFGRRYSGGTRTDQPCPRAQFGNPDFIRDESKECTVRVHDECNGSDV